MQIRQQQRQQQQESQQQEQQQQHESCPRRRHRRRRCYQQSTTTTTTTVRFFAVNAHSSLKLLFVVVVIALATVTSSAQIPTRYFYDHPSSSALAADAQDDEQQAESSRPNLKLLHDEDTNAVPMNFYHELNNITELSEFVDLFVEKDSIDPQENLKRNLERASYVIPKRANCIPENTIVPLTPLSPSRDPNVIYFPECTRVKRCGGCCGSALISCQPVETETINFQVTKYVRQPGNPATGHAGQLRPAGKEIIVVEQHTKCLCDCRVKADDCNAYQLYRKDLCRCECKNHDARDKCFIQEHKIWDENSCRCVCRDSQSCTTGTVFDESQCKCTDPNESVSSAVNDRKRFIVMAVPVEEDNSTVYSL